MGSAAFLAVCSDVLLNASSASAYSTSASGGAAANMAAPFFMPFSQMGVATAPGSMMDTEMPQGASSSLSASVKASRANLEAPYALEKGVARRPAMDPMLTMR